MIHMVFTTPANGLEGHTVHKCRTAASSVVTVPFSTTGESLLIFEWRSASLVLPSVYKFTCSYSLVMGRNLRRAKVVLPSESLTVTWCVMRPETVAIVLHQCTVHFCSTTACCSTALQQHYKNTGLVHVWCVAVYWPTCVICWDWVQSGVHLLLTVGSAHASLIQRV